MCRPGDAGAVRGSALHVRQLTHNQDLVVESYKQRAEGLARTNWPVGAYLKVGGSASVGGGSCAVDQLSRRATW
jgi:hypothetical protein